MPIDRQAVALFARVLAQDQLVDLHTYWFWPPSHHQWVIHSTMLRVIVYRPLNTVRLGFQEIQIER